MKENQPIMDLQLKPLSPAEAARASAPALIALAGGSFQPGGDALSALIQRATDKGHFKPAEAGKLLASYASAGIAADRLVLASAGDGQPARVRQAVLAAFAAFKDSRPESVLLYLAHPATPQALAAAALAASEAAYVYAATKTGKGGKGKEGKAAPTRQITVAAPAAAVAAGRGAFDQAVAMAQGVRLAREWANRPANHATPAMLGEAALALGKLPRMECQALGPKQIAKLGMGALCAVAQGSSQEPRFIVLHYRGAGKADAPVALVGKGITFDAGGISLKPAAEMDEMKFDMSGAASVLGVFRALAGLRPAINVVGLIPACENLPGGRAVKPGDVVTGLSGQTIEILNTDAEGRLILSDALTYAERFKPRAVIDIATLTGACAIALGGVRSGLFSNDDALAAALQEAGESALDPCWRMPLDDEYAEGLKSNFADVANVGGRPAGAVTAAKFLQRFAGERPWAHLDIAGTAWKSGPAKGATGRPVALLLHYLLQQAAAPGGKPARKPAARQSAASARRKSKSG